MSTEDNTVPQLIDPEDSPMDDSENLLNAEGCIDLVDWFIPASYAPKAPNDKCVICHNHLNDKCASCLETKDNILQLNCTVSMGKCGHAFHKHCIGRWITKDIKSCPIDQSPYITQTDDCSQSDWRKLIIQKKRST